MKLRKVLMMRQRQKATKLPKFQSIQKNSSKKQKGNKKMSKKIEHAPDTSSSTLEDEVVSLRRAERRTRSDRDDDHSKILAREHRTGDYRYVGIDPTFPIAALIWMGKDLRHAVKERGADKAAKKHYRANEGAYRAQAELDAAAEGVHLDQ
jgi:hypothetical protein